MLWLSHQQLYISIAIFERYKKNSMIIVYIRVRKYFRLFKNIHEVTAHRIQWGKKDKYF